MHPSKLLREKRHQFFLSSSNFCDLKVFHQTFWLCSKGVLLKGSFYLMSLLLKEFSHNVSTYFHYAYPMVFACLWLLHDVLLPITVHFSTWGGFPTMLLQACLQGSYMVFTRIFLTVCSKMLIKPSFSPLIWHQVEVEGLFAPPATCYLCHFHDVFCLLIFGDVFPSHISTILFHKRPPNNFHALFCQAFAIPNQVEA